MAIKRVKVKNFKSFKELDLNLGDLNVLIGANASGKSNFVQIFSFLRDIKNHGLKNAISMQGGVEYLRNINLGSSENLSFEITSLIDNNTSTDIFIVNSCCVRVFEICYKFSLKFKEKKEKYDIVEDRVILKCKLLFMEENKNRIKKELGEGRLINSVVNGEIKTDFKGVSGVKTFLKDNFPAFFQKRNSPKNNLLLQNFSSTYLPYFSEERVFTEFSIYDFDPKLPKKAVPITGKADLEEDGSNLSIAIRNITEDKKKKRKLFNLIKDTLPFVNNFGVDNFTDKSLLFKVQETYFTKEYLPASLISDGTINLVVLILALYFEGKPLTIIEEPERNIHPHLISRVVEMMREASQNKKIVVTTHNPEIVKNVGLENLLFVSRDKDGFSTISRPQDKDEVKTFLENEIGIEELFVQDLL